MAPINNVLRLLKNDSSCFIGSDDKSHGEASANVDGESSPDYLRQQDLVGETILACWNDKCGPSKRYLKALIRIYVSILEEENICVESDTLLSLVLQSSLSKDQVPQPDEACYLSFRVREDSSNSIKGAAQETDNRAERPLLRIRVYPYHNDVALRLWEAGSCLAEYFLEHPVHVADKHVIELGAGVGFTGLVIAGYCKPKSVYLTDYTEECRINLEHNFEINKKWIQNVSGSTEISQVSHSIHDYRFTTQ